MTTAEDVCTETSRHSESLPQAQTSRPRAAAIRNLLLWSHALLLGLMALALPPTARAAVQYGHYEGDARQLVPSAVIQQNSAVKYNEYSNHAYGDLILGFKDARKASGNYKTVHFGIDVFNSRSKSAQDQCNRPQISIANGDMNRCALEYEMLYRVTNYFEPGKVHLIGEQKFMQTNISKPEYKLFRKSAPKNAFATYHVLELTFLHSDTNVCEYHYQVHAGNVFIDLNSTANGDCNFGEQQQAAYEMANEIVSRLPRTGQVDATAAREVEEAPPVENPDLMVEAYPAPSSAQVGRTAYLPASTKLPAKLVAKTKPGTATTFEILSGKQAQLQAGASKGTRLTIKADGNGVAEALFFYTGANIKAPLAYEVRISTPGRRETATVNVGLGLAFDRIQAIKGDVLDTHAFTLGVKSRFHPKLNLGQYLYSAQQAGIWGDKQVGIKLKTSWVNAPEGASPDQAFVGTTKIVTTPVGESVLVVGKNEAPGEPQYYFGKNLYPAVVMKSDGKHAYQINGGIVLLDKNDAFSEFIQEGMQQGQALALVSRDTPEHWLTSLVCSLETQDEVQYAMLETAKMLPGGDVVDALTSATGLMCKFGKGEYESLFYDLGTIVGGKYLDHLNQPEILTKLTPKQQSAAKLAKKAYDKLDEHKKGEERDKWIGAAGERFRNSRTEQPAAKQPPPPASTSTPSPAPNPTPAQPGNDLKKNVEDLQKSFEELGKTFKGIFN